jgi:hypothetical protein
MSSSSMPAARTGSCRRKPRRELVDVSSRGSRLRLSSHQNDESETREVLINRRSRSSLKQHAGADPHGLINTGVSLSHP